MTLMCVLCRLRCPDVADASRATRQLPQRNGPVRRSHPLLLACACFLNIADTSVFLSSSSCRIVKEGKFAIEETVFEGIENWAVGFEALFTGANTGKVVVRV
jgi:hypothetical protein